MATKKKAQGKPQKLNVTIGTRVPEWVRDFYQRQAESERRKLSDVTRNVLVDHAAKECAA
jgi:hypothetical protein